MFFCWCPCLQARYLSEAQQLLEAIAGVEGEVEVVQREGREQLSAVQQQLAVEKEEAEQRYREEEEQQVRAAGCRERCGPWQHHDGTTNHDELRFMRWTFSPQLRTRRTFMPTTPPVMHHGGPCLPYPAEASQNHKAEENVLVHVHVTSTISVGSLLREESSPRAGVSGAFKAPRAVVTIFFHLPAEASQPSRLASCGAGRPIASAGGEGEGG